MVGTATAASCLESVLASNPTALDNCRLSLASLFILLRVVDASFAHAGTRLLHRFYAAFKDASMQSVKNRLKWL